MSRRPFGTSKLVTVVATLAVALGAALAFVPEDGLEMLWLASDGTSLVGYGRLQGTVLELEVRGDGFGFGVLTVTPQGEARTYVGSVVDGRPRVQLDGTTQDLATYLASSGVELRLRKADGAVVALAPLPPVPVAATPARPAAPGEAAAAAAAPGAGAGTPTTRPAEAGTVQEPDAAIRPPRSPEAPPDLPATATGPLLPTVDAPPRDAADDVADALDEAEGALDGAAGGPDGDGSAGVVPTLGDDDGEGDAGPDDGADVDDDEVRNRDTRGSERAQERRGMRGPDPAPESDSSADDASGWTVESDDDDAALELGPLPGVP